MEDQNTIALGSCAPLGHPARWPEPVITVQTTGALISLHMSARNNGLEEASVMLMPAEARKLARVLSTQADTVVPEAE
jgi:hypothetical protein